MFPVAPCLNAVYSGIRGAIQRFPSGSCAASGGLGSAELMFGLLKVFSDLNSSVTMTMAGSSTGQMCFDWQLMLSSAKVWCVVFFVDSNTKHNVMLQKRKIFKLKVNLN